MSAVEANEKMTDNVMMRGNVDENTVAVTEDDDQINASGHKDQLARQYGPVGLTGIAVTVNNAWVVLGSSISVSICKTT